MANAAKMDVLYMDLAERIAQESHGRRLKVGAVIVKSNNIISMGWNGTPSGMDNNCEIENEDGTLSTKPHVLHAESNALMKLVSNPHAWSDKSTLYVTTAPCAECAKLIKQANISRVVYKHDYRLSDGLQLLQEMNVQVDKLK